MMMGRGVGCGAGVGVGVGCGVDVGVVYLIAPNTLAQDAVRVLLCTVHITMAKHHYTSHSTFTITLFGLSFMMKPKK